MRLQLSLAIRELAFRKTKMFFTVFGIGLVVAMASLIISFSNTLINERSKLLKPLDQMGIDLVVAKKVDDPGKFIRTSGADKVGYENLKAGDRLIRDNLSADALPIITKEEISKISKQKGIKQFSQALLVMNDRLEGIVPEDVEIPEYRVQPLTQEERKQIDAAIEKDSTYKELSNKINAIISIPLESRTKADKQNIIDIENKRSAIEQSYWPERLKKIPQREVKVKEMMVKSKIWSIGSIDPHSSRFGLIAPGNVKQGRFLNGNDRKSIMITSDFAKKEKLKIGDKVVLKNSNYTVVGIAMPSLGQGGADIYMISDELRFLPKVSGTNVLLVKATDSQAADKLEEIIPKLVGNLNITSDSELRAKISGTLIAAAETAKRVTVIFKALIIVASLVIFTLIGLTSLVSRATEVGTLKAIGWSTTRLIWQFFLEIASQVLLGFFAGIMIIKLIGRLFGSIAQVKLSIASPTVGSLSLSGLNGKTIETASRLIPVQSQLNWQLLIQLGAMAFITVCLSSLIIGGKLARLRPALTMKRID
jgi:ABC-type antimicrobial peptide transport system permease subunit